MKYYTIQSKEAYEQAMNKGTMSASKEYVWEEFLVAYDWMIQQMNNRIGHNGTYPIWLWTEKRDLHDEALLPSGTAGVQIEVEMPTQQVLLSDFEAWHMVLMNDFLALSGEEDELFSAGKLNITKEASWERVFDLQLLNGSDYWAGEQVIQVTTGEINVSQFKKVEHFIAK
ncbi:DUF3841 domain-containing protein [Lysinibacillus sp. LZ02]|uniref:DUF3841 domain-containing protein n=1 Tax=Lysinibacillus sp. LZ02 TaxID=3420668 RepID=UPI003D36D608